MTTNYQAGAWDLDYELGPGGLVLTDVHHRHYPLANDIRLTRVWGAAPDFPAQLDPRVGALKRDFVPGSAQQVGVFRDAEDTPSLRKTFPHRPTIADVFAGAEKPLHHELIGPGLRGRKAPDGPGPRTWDNYHHFPKSRDGSLPSTPGAFHCLHLHWRWGAVSATPSYVLPLVGGPQFKGLGWTPELGGPLIDPAVPAQDLTFAVTADTGPEPWWAPESNPSEWPFEDLFTKHRPEPLPVKNGAKLVLWLSVEVDRPPGKEHSVWGGTLLQHGMYFAHDFEPGVLFNPTPEAGPIPPILTALGGLRDPLQKESVPEDRKPMPWWRYPPA